MNEEVVSREVKKTGRPSDARERILESTLQLLAERGIGGVGVEAIMERAGVGKGSVYHFFKSKEGLFHAAIEECTRRVEEDLEANVFLSSHDPLEIPLRLFQHLTTERDRHRGLIWLATECITNKEMSETTRRQISNLFQALCRRLEVCFRRSIAEHELLPNAPAKELAMACLAFALGALFLTQCENQKETPNQLLPILSKIWELYLP